MSAPRRRRARHRVLAAGLTGLALAHLADAALARRRLGSLHTLPLVDDPKPDAVGAPIPDGRRLVPTTVAGVTVEAGALTAAQAHADAHDLDVVDLVPAGLGAEALLALARRTGADRPAGTPPSGRPGAGHALLLRADLAPRLGGLAAGGTDVAAHALARLSRAADRAAPGGRATVLVPPARVPAPPLAGGADGWERLDAVTEVGRPYTSLAAVAVSARAAHLAVLAAGLALSPVAGAAALAAWWAKPALAAAGHAPDVGGATARRPLAQVSEVAGLARAGLAAARRDAAARRAAPPWTAPPPPTLFEPRRASCPWCRSPNLGRRLTTTDLLQHKPGVFVLDECRSCGHVFQNPQLNPAGLDTYYDQFYDGIGGELMTQLFASGAPDNVRRIAAVEAAVAATGVRVQRWLDVGTGHGHFPLAARRHWPEVTFDGLDLSEAVELAAARGWLDGAHRGLFPEVAPTLGGYDVVSMHHYLEHTRDPVEELDAVAKLLDGGALLEVEVPDPECVMSRLLGRYWLPWLQPQHLHFVPAGNLVAALEERNFEVVSFQRDHQAIELVAALALALEDLLPSPQFPWHPPASPARQLARGALMTGFLPVFAVAAGLDHLAARVLTGRGPANTYRVVARKL